MPRQFPLEFRQRALRMLEEALPEHESECAAMRHVGSRLGSALRHYGSGVTGMRSMLGFAGG